ncbi:protein REDUCED WALL ACETYLATION 1-like [Anneissia japonica]|uniref:protein REDUCED WALL ACETYLATION 1-like n=1 Tax=Anneissia japonica TaxID=1529436 RepID=UPI001425B429|nr:protein REDUCED WALL ACETYLATION 1-like [Anneissia japonica]
MVAMTTNNQYMLYYICAMHTYWFISVYVFMRVLSSWNEQPKRMALKFFAYFIFNALIFDVPHVADTVFLPFWPVLSYKDSLHEWKFRAGLDHYATLVGMLCAYNYPHFERFIKYIDQKHIDPRDFKITVAIKVMTVGVLCMLILVWYDALMFRDKFEYNLYHPYTSWFPIISFIFVRNIFPVFRTHHIGLFAWLGKVTLETYISQLHIYMQYNATKTIVYIAGYPLMNFVVASLIYLFVSHQLFKLTTEFSAYLLPKDMKKVMCNFIGVVLVFALYFCLAFLLRDSGVL